jgi:hypothetical protein
MVEEYLSAKRKQVQDQLNKRWVNNAGMDISGILRGKLEVYDEMLEMKHIFDRFDNLEKTLKDAEKGAGK